MKDFEVKNCGCNQDPCKTYGSEEEQKAEYEELKETKMKKPSMESLLNDWRKLLKEHVTDEEHEHPHGDEYDELEEGSTYSETSSTRAIDENDEGSSSSESSSSRVIDESDEDHCDESDETIEEMIQRISKEVLHSKP